MYKWVSVLIFFLTGTYGLSQTATIEWGEETKKASFLPTLDLVEYKAEQGISFFSREKLQVSSDKFMLYKFNENLSPKESHEIELDVYLAGGKGQILGVVEDKIIMSSLNGSSQTNKIFSFSISDNGRVENRETHFSEKFGEDSKLYFSEDSTKVLLVVFSKEDGVKCIVLDKNLNQEKEFYIKQDLEIKNTNINSFAIDTEGNVAGIESMKKKGFSKLTKSTVYREQFYKRVYSYDKDFNLIYTKDFIFPDKNLNIMDIKLDNANLYIFASYYLEDSENEIDNGIALIHLNEEGEEVSSEFLDFGAELVDQKAIDNLTIEKIRDGYYLFAECYKTMGSSESSYHMYGDLFCIKIDKDFKEVWSTIIQKNQISKGSFIYHLDQNGPSFFYRSSKNKITGDNSDSVYGVFLDNLGKDIKKELYIKSDKIPFFKSDVFRQQSNGKLVITSEDSKKIRIGYVSILEE